MAKRYNYKDMLKIMAKLRGPGGCPWDREQTHKSLVKYLREESKEVEQAIRKKDYPNLCEELGDLLHQIIFHADIAQAKGRFTMNDVINELCKKMVRRHPHVFGSKKLHTAEEVIAQWDQIKAREKKKRKG